MRSSSTRGFYILSLLLLLHNECSAATENQAVRRVLPEPLPRATIPQSYEMKLIPELVGRNLSHHGEAKIGVKVFEQTWNVTLHSQELLIDETFTSLVDANGVAHRPRNHTHVWENSFLIIQFDEPITVGIYTLNLKFTSNTTHDTPGSLMILREHANGDPTEWSIFSGFSQRRTIFPCWDEMDLKATFNLSIKHSANYTALSNMPVRHSYLDTDGKRWTNFETSPPLATDLVAFVISDIDCIRNENETLSFWGRRSALPSLKFALDVSERTLEFLEKYMGFKKNFTKLDSYSMPSRDNYPAMTPSWGLVLYEHSFINYEPFKDSLSTRSFVTWDAVSGIIHQWMANSATLLPESWKYAWIVSGLSTYLEYYIVDKLYPDWRLLDALVALTSSTDSYFMDDYNMPQDWKMFKEKPNKQVRMYDAWWGSIVFRMLSNIISEDVYNAGLAKFVNENQHRIVTVDDLWNAMQSVYDIKKKKSNGDLAIKQVMTAWTEQRGHPLLNVTRDYKTGRIVITQQSSIVNETSNRWWVPINFATKSNPNFAVTAPTHWLKPGEESLIIDGVDKDDWIIVNIQRSGLYRVDYDETNWKRITKYMNSENYLKIHVLNRAQLLSDLHYMTKLNRRNITTLLDLCKYLSREDEYIAWYEVKEIISTLKTSVNDDAVEAEISNFFIKLMDKYVGKYGFEDRSAYKWEKKYKPFYNSLDNRTKKYMPVEQALEKYYKDGYKDGDFLTNQYRRKVLTFACSLGHRTCLDSARSQLRAYIENAAKNPISVNLDKWVKCYGAEGNEDYLMSLVTNATYVTYISAVGCSPNKTSLWKYVEEILSGDRKDGWSLFNMAISYLIPNNMIPKDHLNPMVFNVIKNFDKIYNYYKNSNEELYPKNLTDRYIAYRLKKHIKYISTLEGLKEAQGLKQNIPVAIIPLFDEYISQQKDVVNKRIQRTDKTPALVHKWIQDNSSPVQTAS